MEERGRKKSAIPSLDDLSEDENDNSSEELLIPVVKKGTNFIVIGDVHFRAKSIATLGVSFISKCIALITPLIQKREVEFIVLLGDILDTHEKAHVLAFNQAYDFIKKCADLVPTFVLMGNHDLMNNKQFLSTDHFFNPLKEYKNVHIIDTPSAYDIDESRRYIFCPFVAKGRLIEALDNSLPDWRKQNVFLVMQKLQVFTCLKM